MFLRHLIEAFVNATFNLGKERKKIIDSFGLKNLFIFEGKSFFQNGVKYEIARRRPDAYKFQQVFEIISGCHLLCRILCNNEVKLKRLKRAGDDC